MEREGSCRCHETLDGEPGRVDERSYRLTKVPRNFGAAKDWPWVKSIDYSGRLTRNAPTARSPTRCATTSAPATSAASVSAKRTAATRGAKSMHWVLDVNYREDDSRTRERTLGNNLSWLRQFAVTILKRYLVKDSLRGKMICCVINTEFLTEAPSLQ